MYVSLRYVYACLVGHISIVSLLLCTNSAPLPSPPLPSLSISAGVHNWIIFTSVPATSSGSKEAKTDIKSYRKRKKNTCKYPTILCQRCPDTLSCYGGVLILCPVMERCPDTLSCYGDVLILCPVMEVSLLRCSIVLYVVG